MSESCLQNITVLDVKSVCHLQSLLQNITVLVVKSVLSFTKPADKYSSFFFFFNPDISFLLQTSPNYSCSSGNFMDIVLFTNVGKSGANIAFFFFAIVLLIRSVVISLASSFVTLNTPKHISYQTFFYVFLSSLRRKNSDVSRNISSYTLVFS
uniref:Uncharacterized protein n=1 Tax=Cacopsylla melanoneura TaxID=428564 RepID=A0A8D9BU43_9HEMI